MGGENTLGEIIDLNATRLVVIHDEWVGYNPHSPIATLYELRRGARGGLSDEGRRLSSLAGERVVDVTITAGAAKKFLGAIASADVVEGTYQPRQEWTDDYPHIELALHVGVGEIERRGCIALLFTESQGEFYAPWGACIDRRMWTVPGEEIGRALAALKVPLKRATLDRMMQEFERQAAQR
ncbi:hypothetical protein [Vitiosangium sp. GDMCC 1.1324]|uniref:hypothetical protein n=1 Tax=Vitiosangium sp. (strain GDMCC 1.1324) TaxID=2138576 RepID=UPI000D386453|nr:hypothetical protein [Vitiosangium sp. GDMCC 1.1324]PTL79236.1 hypothetical protein DAT35_34055 [Vitiosangium sp. GDMCC 1.1324]